MSNVTTEGLPNIPSHPVMIFPNRVNLDVVHALEQTLGATRIAWLVNYDEPKPDEEVMAHLTSIKAAGSWISLQRMSREMLSERVHDLLAGGRHVVLLQPRPAQQPASLADISAPLLRFLDGSTLPALPVYAGMYTEDADRAICTEPPCGRTCVQFMPVQPAGAGLGARVRGAWMEAAARQFSDHPLLQGADLREALIAALNKHPQARIIDGVDDSTIDFETVLVFALLAARQLSKEILSREIGIILPPGKLCIIANLACLFAGITPVNFNYEAGGETFRAQAKRSRVNRYITEHRFTLKQHSFAWPRKLDQVYIDDILRDIGTFRVNACKRLLHWRKDAASVLGKKTPAAHPEDTAAVFFTKSTGEAVQGVPASHRMLSAAVLQLQSRLRLQPGERVLSVTPFHEPHGFLFGMLLPLLCGLDIVTYPDTRTPSRIGILCENFGPKLCTFTVPQTYELLSAVRPDTFAAMRHFIVTGSRIPPALFNKALKEFKLTLHNAYTVAESCAPVALCMDSPESPDGKWVVPAGAPGTTGIPLTGTAVRVVDTDNPDQPIDPGSPGCIWLHSPCIPEAYLPGAPGKNGAEAFRNGWFCTGDVGCVDANGMLHVLGRRTRFSKIDGIVTSHEMVEEVILGLLKQEASGPRKLAVVGLPTRDGERLVLLSTLHPHAGPQDVLTLRYAITNAHHPSHWKPDKIISVRAIPTLPNGQLDYDTCLAVVRQALGSK